MNYAELTDDELRLEVARRCGYRWYAGLDTSAYHLAKPDEKPYHADWREVDTTSGFYFTNAPDYPHDLTAAISLLDGMTYPPEPDGRVLHVEYVILKETYHHLDDIDPLDKPRFIVEISSRNPIYGDSHWATADTLPRAACVAWLMWMDARKEAQHDNS